MLGKQFIMAAALFCVGITHAMENKSLQRIQDWQDVTPFAGKVVAYMAAMPYLDSGYKYVLPNSDLSYGYIENYPSRWGVNCGNGYNLRQLLKKGGVGSNTALANKYIDEGSLYMRDVNSQEAYEIINVLTSKKAAFSMTYGNEEKKLWMPQVKI